MRVDKHRVGTAFGPINMLQSLGLAVSNFSAGWLNDALHAGPRNPTGYDAMLGMVASLSLVSFVATALLRMRERRSEGGGIEAVVVTSTASPHQRH